MGVRETDVGGIGCDVHLYAITIGFLQGGPLHDQAAADGIAVRDHTIQQESP
jgi:hypothetical protein